MKNRLFLISLCVLSFIGLAACDDSLLAWSPDGNKIAFVGHDGLLRFGDSNGKLSIPVGNEPKQLAWLPDSKHLLIAERIKVGTWNGAQKFLTEQEQIAVKNLAQYILRRLELNGIDGLDHDTKLDETPSYIASAAFIFLAETDGPHLKVVLGPKMAALAGLNLLEVNSLSLCSEDVKEEKKEIWHGLADLVGARVSPDGKYVLLVRKMEPKSNSFALELLATEPGSIPRKVAETIAEHADWSPDSRKIVFMEQIDHNNDTPKMGALSTLDVRTADGALVKTSGSPSRLVYVAANQSSDIHCLKDGRILFSSSCVQLPATGDELSSIQSVFSIKSGEQFARKLMSIKGTEDNQGVTPMQVNSDDTWVILGCGGSLNILNIGTGNIVKLRTQCEPKASWRNADEVCYAKPNDNNAKNENHHDAEIVLHSMTTGKDRIISADWPPSAVDEVLIQKKQKK